MAAMLIIGGISAAASIYGAHKASKASKEAAATQSASAQQAIDLQRDMYGQTRTDLTPYREQGGQGLTALSSLLQSGPGDFTTSPGYAFRLAEGQKAIERSAAARGTLLTGGTLKGMERFAQGLASDEYQRFLNQYNTQVNQYGQLAGMGQNASSTRTPGPARTRRAGCSPSCTDKGGDAWH